MQVSLISRVLSRHIIHLQGTRLLVGAGNPSLFNTSTASFSSRRGGGRKRGGKGNGSGLVKTPPPPANTDPWEEVKDQNGNIYYWNTVTDETTAIGEPRPTAMSVHQPQSGGIAGAATGFAGMVAQGMAFGAGSSMAHHAIGGLFGGGGGGGGDDDHGDSGGDDGSWDI